MIQFDCPQCGKSTNAPSEMAGQKARCPACKGVLTIPTPANAGFAAIADPSEQKIATPGAASGPPPIPSEEARRPCPACGEMIMATARKCRFCNEFFDRALHAGPMTADGRRRGTPAGGLMIALGILYFFGAVISLFGGFANFAFADLPQFRQRPEITYIQGAILIALGLLWLIGGIGGVMRRIWGIYAGLAAAYAHLATSIIFTALTFDAMPKAPPGQNQAAFQVGFVIGMTCPFLIFVFLIVLSHVTIYKHKRATV